MDTGKEKQECLERWETSRPKLVADSHSLIKLISSWGYTTDWKKLDLLSMAHHLLTDRQHSKEIAKRNKKAKAAKRIDDKQLEGFE